MHHHYEDIVAELSRIGLQSPIAADEYTVKHATAFHLKQNLLRSQKGKIGCEGDKLHEWFHPPLIRRSMEAALQGVSSRRPRSARPKPQHGAMGPDPSALSAIPFDPILQVSRPTESEKCLRVAMRRQASRPAAPPVRPAFVVKPSADFPGCRPFSARHVSPLITPETLMKLNVAFHKKN